MREGEGGDGCGSIGGGGEGVEELATDVVGDGAGEINHDVNG